jgi:hypothetical protein
LIVPHTAQRLPFQQQLAVSYFSFSLNRRLLTHSLSLSIFVADPKKGERERKKKKKF